MTANREQVEERDRECRARLAIPDPAKPYSADEIETIRRMAAEGASSTTIGKAIGRSQQSVSVKCSSLKIKLQYVTHYSAEDLETLRVMSDAGYPATSIAKRLRKTVGSIYTRAAMLDIHFRRRPMPTKGTGKYKLSPSLQRAYAHEAADLGMTPNQLARLLHETIIKDSLVRAILDVDPKKFPLPAEPYDHGPSAPARSGGAAAVPLPITMAPPMRAVVVQPTLTGRLH